MLTEGTVAPAISLPGVVEGEVREFDLGASIGEGIVVLAFYPADFNPACGEERCDLTELDLFTMQQDVEVFAVSPDSSYSHRAFAEAYSLSLPLLSDTHGEAIEAYDVRDDTSEQLLAQRAVFVIDQHGEIRYAWSTTDRKERPDVDAVREAVSNIGGDPTAVGRYRVGYAHYREGRRAFTSAMGSYEDRDWLLAQSDFERAMAEFQEAAEQFQSAVRFAQSAELEGGFERADRKATALWQAAEWLAESAGEYASGNGEAADDYRTDAESPLQVAREIGEPPDPDDIVLDVPAKGATTESGDDALTAPTDPARDEADEQATAPSGTETDIDAAVESVEAETDADGESQPDKNEGEIDVELDLNDPT